MKINTLKEMVGAVVPEVTGEILKLWPAKNGVTNGKSWSLQGGTIKDETGEIDFTIWNRTELPQSLRGVTMTIKSGLGVKGGLRGLKVDKNKKDPSKLVLQVEDKATIMDKENSIQEDAKDDIPMDEPKKSSEFNNATTEINREVDENIRRASGVKSPQERIAQFGKLYAMCVDPAHSISKGFDKLTTGDIKDIATTFFIQACKEGLADKMEMF